jgi:uncharacterized protein (TIGR00290 family)
MADPGVDDIVLLWSGGKDSALTLWALRRASESIRALLTTVTEEYERVSMHGVRAALLREQARVVGLPLIEVTIPPDCPNELYEARMAEVLESAPLRSCRRYAFGDLFLEDVRAHREERLGASKKEGVWPIWGRDTHEVAEEFIDLGFEAIVVCVDPRMLDARFAGRDYDAAFLADLPDDVDPCGERGEFHTFVHDGPAFATPIRCRRGDVVQRDGFVFCDLVPLTDVRPSRASFSGSG